MAIWHFVNAPISAVENTMSESLRRYIYTWRRREDTTESEGYDRNRFISMMKDHRSREEPEIREVSIILLPMFFLKSYSADSWVTARLWLTRHCRRPSFDARSVPYCLQLFALCRLWLYGPIISSSLGENCHTNKPIISILNIVRSTATKGL